MIAPHTLHPTTYHIPHSTLQILSCAIINSAMTLFGSQTKTGGADVIFDIHSGSIGAAIVTFDGQPIVHWSTRKPIDFLSEHDTDKLLQTTKRKIAAVAETVHDDALDTLRAKEGAPNTIGNVEVFISAPWHVGGAQKIIVRKDDPFTIDGEQLQLAQTKAEEMFREQAAQQFGAQQESMQSLETIILKTKCNGYTLENPRGATAADLSVFTHVSLVPKRVKETLEAALSDYFHPDRITLRSFVASLYRTFSGLFVHPTSFVIIDVDEEITRLILIESGSIAATVPFQLGSHFVVREVANELDVPAADAHAKIDQYTSGNQTKQVSTVVESARARWQEQFRAALDDLSADISIPEFAYLLAEADTSSLFAEFARNIDVKDQLITTDQFRVHEVDDSLLTKHLTQKEDTLDHYASTTVLAEQIARGQSAMV